MCVNTVELQWLQLRKLIDIWREVASSWKKIVIVVRSTLFATTRNNRIKESILVCRLLKNRIHASLCKLLGSAQPSQPCLILGGWLHFTEKLCTRPTSIYSKMIKFIQRPRLVRCPSGCKIRRKLPERNKSGLAVIVPRVRSVPSLCKRKRRQQQPGIQPERGDPTIDLVILNASRCISARYHGRLACRLACFRRPVKRDSGRGVRIESNAAPLERTNKPTMEHQ